MVVEATATVGKEFTLMVPTAEFVQPVTALPTTV